MAATTIPVDVYSDALVVLGTAGVVVPLVKRLGLSPVLGWLGAGAILGPLGLGSFRDAVPLLYWFTVVEAKNVSLIADLGVVFLLFLIGLELSYERLTTMRRLVFGLGSLQVILSTLAIGGIVNLAGAKPAVAVVIGACLALSSTAIVLELLSAQSRLSTTAGRTSFAVLLAQDMAVVPILLMVGILGASAGGSVIAGVATALAKAAFAIVAIVVIGRLLLRPLFRHVATSGTRELFVAATLFVIVAAGLVAGLAGLSMALGAFVAGLLLAETEYRKAIESTIEPFKGLLLGLFFFSVGMSIDLREIARQPLMLAGAVVGLIVLKAAIMIGLARFFRISWRASIETGLLIGPAGEFGLVGIGMAAALGLIAAQSSSFAVAVISSSMALIPLLSMIARRISQRLAPAKPLAPELAAMPNAEFGKDHVLVIGQGRVGQVVSTMLDRHGIDYLAIENDPASVTEQRHRGRNVYFGDAGDEVLLKHCGLMVARAVIVTVRSQSRIDDIVGTIRALRPDVAVISRARDAGHARHLYAIGVTDAVPETIEASLQLSEAALIGLGKQAGPVIASIHELRDEFRKDLQQAAGAAGLPATRGVRATQKGAG
jgi:CPA2 family monovalent cation:H+ antiporter-2